MTGRIKTLIRERGFGFIRDDEGNDYFFHRSEMRTADWPDLYEGLAVGFSVSHDDHGRTRACGVKVISVPERAAMSR